MYLAAIVLLLLVLPAAVGARSGGARRIDYTLIDERH
jgi:hypothetical protein